MKLKPSSVESLTRSEAKTKLVSWAYPSSSHAVKLGYAKTGCYVVEYVTASSTDLATQRGFNTRDEAMLFALDLPESFNWMQRIQENQK